jgi:2-(3-amino-3-carboxypropyl)histidine synthase
MSEIESTMQALNEQSLVPVSITPASNPIKHVKSSSGSIPTHAINGIPSEIEHNKEIDSAMSVLPSNYNFEIKKSIWKIKQNNAKRVALQFPEGLLLYSCVIGDILEKFTGAEIVIMGDVTYGACCIDDLGASSIGCDFLIHYGHSCLVPIDSLSTNMKVLYVFVSIAFDFQHFLDCVYSNFPAKDTKIALLGTIQFWDNIHSIKQTLNENGYTSISIPQAKPLSPGEVLGCTSPSLSQSNVDMFIFISDGRFHLESTLIANPSIQHAYKYDPYSKIITREKYDHGMMFDDRLSAIQVFQEPSTKIIGVILGTLGRQGNLSLFHRICNDAVKVGNKRVIPLLLSEVTPAKIKQLVKLHCIDAFVQVACPRLSIDWGSTSFDHVPVLSPYEFYVAIKQVEWKSVYPMDFYARGSGSWTNYYKEPQVKTLPS